MSIEDRTRVSSRRSHGLWACVAACAVLFHAGCAGLDRDEIVKATSRVDEPAVEPTPGPDVAELFASYQTRLSELSSRWNTEPLRIGIGKQVFYDDAVLATKLNFVRKMGRVTKANDGKPVIEATQKWETPQSKTGVGTAISVVRRPDGLFQAWYNCGRSTYYGTLDIGYAESTNGVDWTKPYKRSVLYPCHAGGVYYDPYEKRAKYRYKIAYGDTAGSDPPLIFGHSDNGGQWSRYSSFHNINEEHNFRVDTINNLFYDDELGAYRVFSRSRVGSRVRGMKQFIKPGFDDASLSSLVTGGRRAAPVLAVQEEMPPVGDSYCFSAHKSGGLYIGKMSFYYESVHYCLALSRNGVTWDWKYLGITNAFIPRGPPGSFDAGAVWAGVTPFVEVGDELFIYYGGMTKPYNNSTVVPPLGSPEPHLSAIGLAKIRLDGVFHLESISMSGVVETRLFVWEGSSLKLNIDASLGEAVVEMLGEDGKPIPGFTGSDADRITTDATGMTVTWGKRSDLTGLKGKVVKVRIKTIGFVKMYAFEVVGDSSQTAVSPAGDELLNTGDPS